MHVDSLSLADFRSYERLQLELSPGITVMLGPNGVGKTNIVEAIDYAATLTSHRVSGNAPLHRAGTERAVIRTGVRRAGHRTALEFTLAEGRTPTVRLNRGGTVRAREALGVLRTVLFSPEDLALIKGEPSGRRSFLDVLGASMRPALAGVIADYEKTVRQRNALLKSARRSGRFTEAHEATLSAWNDQLATYGAAVLQSRLQLVLALEPEVRRAYGQLADGPRAPALRYRSSILPEAADGRIDQLAHFTAADLRELMLEACTQLQEQEVERAVSLVGPHRDELEILLGDLPARGYASHGEMWSCALSLRLGSWYVHLDDDRSEGSSPVLILDDVFAELDARRRSRLAAMVSDAEQVLVTAAVEEDVPRELLDSDSGLHIVRVTPGAAVVERGSDRERDS
ncbi:DNA replication/repair protein RecF [Kocuria palustris]|uniref:DNA replication/repair protein RecF n=1 Tax=Kocuria palustris TaxID=71999 RepID=UPI0011A4E365|nr:DNA replication/repair protein RecF [Kocuria palustris]